MSQKHRPSNVADITFPREQAVSFDAEAFDEAVRSQGVDLIHYRAMRCPVGMIDQYDVRRPHDDHSGCSNGFIYTKAGVITCLFTSNSLADRQMDVGLLDGSTVQITAPTFYNDSSELVQIAPFDRIYLLDEAVTVPHWQLVEAHVTGLDKLSRPATSIFDIMDNHGKRYDAGDFTLLDGQVKWLGQNRPGFNPVMGRGNVYAIRYSYRPYFYVSRVMHEVRVSQIDDPISGERSVRRMPQSFMLTREYIHEKSDNDDLSPETPDRKVKGPREGSFGPR